MMSAWRDRSSLDSPGNRIRNFSSALLSVVSRVSEIRDPGRAAGRIGVRFDPLQGELGFDFRLTGFGSKASSLVCSDRHPTGGRLQIGMAEIKSESVADFIPESVTDLLRNQQKSARYL
jgi:hypothetical protein